MPQRKHLEVLAALLVGALIYTIGRPHAGHLLPEWVQFCLPDGLWTFALVRTLGLVWRDRVNWSSGSWMGAGVLAALLWEVGQSVGLVAGTFDPVDLLFIGMGSLFALLRMEAHA